MGVFLMSDVEESRMLKTAESVARDKTIKIKRAEASAGSSSRSAPGSEDFRAGSAATL